MPREAAPRELLSLDAIPRDARVYLHCAGVYGRQLNTALRRQRPDVRVLGFIDTYKQGAVDGIDIHRLEDVIAGGAVYDFIVIAIQPEVQEQIASLLEAAGVDAFTRLSPDFRLTPAESRTTAPRVLHAFYDLDVSPTSFAFLMFLYLAEIERRRRGLDVLQPVLVPRSPHRLDLVRADEVSDRAEDTDSDGWMLRNILVPCCWLVPGCGQLTVCASRAEAERLAADPRAHRFPRSYDPACPEEHYSHFKILEAFAPGHPGVTLRAPPKALEYVSAWLSGRAEGRKPVTLTLRETVADTARNSNLDAWTRFAAGLDRNQYYPVFLRDTDAALTPTPAALDGFELFPEGPWNLELRMALYEAAYLNLFVNNGPAALCSLNYRTRYLTFVYRTDQQFSCSDDYYASAGVEIGSPFPGAAPFQRTVWEGGDSYDNLCREFAAMCSVLEAESPK